MTQEAIEELSTLQCHDLRAEPPGDPSRRSEPPDSDFRRDQNRLPQHLGSDGTVKGRRQALRKALKANEATEKSSTSRPMFSVGGGRKWVQSQDTESRVSSPVVKRIRDFQWSACRA